MENNATEEIRDDELNRDHTGWSLFLFVLPAIITYVFNGLYTSVDGAFIEKFEGPFAIAAVNLYYPVLNLTLALGMMIGSGGGVALAALRGQNEGKKADGLFTQLILFTGLIGVIIAAAGNIFADRIIVWLGASEGNLPYFVPYYRVMVTLSPILIYAAILMPFFLAEGKNVAIAVTSIGGGILNIVLDYLFMGPLGLGIAGAAAATMIGYGLPVAYALLFYLTKKPWGSSFRFCRYRLMPKRILLALYNGSSEMVTNLANGVTALIMNHLAYRFFTEIGVSVVSVYLYVQFMIMAVFMGMTAALEPLISYHYGSRNFVRGKKVYGMALRMTGIFSAVIFAVMVFFYKDIVTVFFASSGEEAQFYTLACASLAFALPACLITGFNIFISGLFTAYGNGTVSAILSVLRTFVFLVAAMYLLTEFWHAHGLWLSWFAAEVPSLIVGIIFLIRYREKYGLKKQSPHLAK